MALTISGVLLVALSKPQSSTSQHRHKDDTICGSLPFPVAFAASRIHLAREILDLSRCRDPRGRLLEGPPRVVGVATASFCLRAKYRIFTAWSGLE